MGYTAEHKRNARFAAVAFGIRQGMERIVLNGDTKDARPSWPQQKQEVFSLRDALEQFSGEKLVLPGNHDDKVSRADFREQLGCELVDPMMADEHGRLILHGHWAMLKHFRQLVQQVLVKNERGRNVFEAWKDDPLLRSRVRGAHHSNICTEFLEHFGIRHIGERFISFCLRVGERVAARLQSLHVSATIQPILRYGTNWLRIKMFTAAAEAARAAGCQSVHCGHLHEEGIFDRSIFDPITHTWNKIVVVNSGSAIQEGHPLTFVYSCIDPTRGVECIVLLAYDAELGDVVPIQYRETPIAKPQNITA